MWYEKRGSTLSRVLPQERLRYVSEALRLDVSARGEHGIRQLLPRVRGLRKDHRIPLPVASLLGREVDAEASVEHLELDVADAQREHLGSGDEHPEGGVGVTEEGATSVVLLVTTELEIGESDLSVLNVVEKHNGFSTWTARI